MTASSSRFASGVSNSMDLTQAMESIFTQVEIGLGESRVDFVFLFTTGHYAEDCVEISRLIHQRLAPAHLIGCTGEGVIGSTREFERQAAISLLAGSLPGVRLKSFHISQSLLDDFQDDIELAYETIGFEPSQKPSFVLLAEPFSIKTMTLVSTLDVLFPGSVKLGGVASAGMSPGLNRMYWDHQTFLEGAVGVALDQSLEILPVVSQGCRPLGDPLLVTRAEENLIHTLAGQPALEVLRDLFNDLPEEDRQLAQNALLVGVVIDEYKSEFQRGDFLIRNLIGADPQTGVLVLNDRISAGQTLQFHVRDAVSAEEDMEELLLLGGQRIESRQPLAALMFNCNGRGTRMFTEPHHDVTQLHSHLTTLPTAGFFCAGEIGPIGGKTFIHGFTNSIGILLPGTPPSSSEKS